MKYDRNYIAPYERINIDFETANEGDQYLLKLDGKEVKALILSKDNWNKMLIKLTPNEELNPAYAVVKFQTWYIAHDAHPGIEFESNDLGWTLQHWLDLKSKESKEKVEEIKTNMAEWLEKPLETKPIGNSNTMDQWAEYQSNIMGWNGR